MRKRFNKDLYEHWHNKAREWIEKKKPKGLILHDHKNKTAVDLVASYKSLSFYMEIEVKAVWKTGEFPYEDIQLPERKRKYCNLDCPTLFTMFRRDGKQMRCFWSQDVIKSPLAEVPNKYIFKGEKFFKIPLSSSYKTILSAIRPYL